MRDRKIVNFKFIVLLICGLTLGTDSAIAQQGKSRATIKFAVVNFQKIFREAAATRSIAPQIVKLKKSFESQFKDIQKKLQLITKKIIFIHWEEL